MDSFKQYLDRAKSIKDINDKYDYVDEHPQGKGDSNKVACGQNGTYNELQYIYDNYLQPKVEDGKITKQEAIDALDSACESLDNPRKRVKFYGYLEDTLEITIDVDS